MRGQSEKRPERLRNGLTLAERAALRRVLIDEAGLTLLGAPGGPAVSVRRVCAEASLTERYFYESYADRDALVLAVYDRVAVELQEALGEIVAEVSDPVEVARRSVEAMLALCLDDPRKGRALLLAPLTEPALTPRTLHLLPVVAGLIAAELPARTNRQLLATTLLGALMAVFYAALEGSFPVSRGDVRDQCLALLLNADRLGGVP